jgi:uncharacterized protein
LALRAVVFFSAVVGMLDRTTCALIVEGGFALVGLGLIWQLVLHSSARSRAEWRLEPWHINPADVLTFALFIVGFYVVGGLATGLLCKPLALSEDQKLIALSAGSQFAMLAGPVLYGLLYRQEFAVVVGPARSALTSGMATFFISLPFVFGVGFVWVGLLNLLGLPVEKQDAIELFARTHASGWLWLLTIVAVVMAPMAEELIFRAGLFRYFRTRLPRWVAFILPAFIFAAMHRSLASFGQLATLAVVFSVAYERTGRIATCMVAHALFNLNMVALLLLGIDF